MGLFFYTKKGSIISTVDLPTTEIIEPVKIDVGINVFAQFLKGLVSLQVIALGLKVPKETLNRGVINALANS